MATHRGKASHPSTPQHPRETSHTCTLLSKSVFPGRFLDHSWDCLALEPPTWAREEQTWGWLQLADSGAPKPEVQVRKRAAHLDTLTQFIYLTQELSCIQIHHQLDKNLHEGILQGILSTSRERKSSSLTKSLLSSLTVYF